MTSSPASSSASTRCEPMKPAPPVTSALTGCGRARAPRGSAGGGGASPARPSRPAAAVATSSAIQVSALSTTWNQTISAGSSSAYCVDADEALAGQQHADRGHRVLRRGVHLARADQEPDADRTPARGTSPARRAGGSPSRASPRRASPAAGPRRRCPRRPRAGPAAVAIVPSASVSAPGHAAAAARPRWSAGRSTRGRSPGSNVARQTSATQATSSAIESRKCPITQPGREPVDHGQPAHHGLPEHARAAAAARSSARSRRNGRRRHAQNRRGQARDRDHARHHAVGELDDPVRVQLGREPRAVAARPVRAAEAGARQPHGRAGEDDQRADARAPRRRSGGSGPGTPASPLIVPASRTPF